MAPTNPNAIAVTERRINRETVSGSSSSPRNDGTNSCISNMVTTPQAALRRRPTIRPAKT